MSTVTIPHALELAIQHQEAGRLAEAEVIYRQILAAQPNHAEAHHLLGVIAHQAGRNEAAVELIQRAILLGLRTASPHSNLGEAYRGLGRLDEAIAAYRGALQIKPDLAAAHSNLGIALREQGRIEEAVAAFGRAIELLPKWAEAHHHLAACLLKQGRLDEAIAECRCALRLRPDAAECFFDLGVALTKRGRLEEAVVAYRGAIRLRPDYVPAHHNLGSALLDLGQAEEAESALRRAVELQPNYADAHYNLGNALKAQGRLDEAVAAFRRVLELQPNHGLALNNLGNTYKEEARLEEAVATFRRAVDGAEADAGVQSNLVVTLHYLPGVDDGTIAAEQARWNRRHADPVKGWVRPSANDRDPARRLRIGYVSPDLRDHTLGRNLLPLFRHHDRRNFEILCYAGVVHPDQLTAEFRQYADAWHDTVEKSDEVLAEMIRRDEVDILVDLALHTAGNRLPVLAREPAPVQVSFAGYPGSTGVEAVEHRISDRYLEGEMANGSCQSGREREPAHETASREQVHLIDSFWCYDPCGMELEVNELPAQRTGQVTFGSLNNFCKINAPVLKLWARAMREVEGSRLLLLSPEGSHRQQVLETLAQGGVAEERVEFVAPHPRKEYLELYHRVDVMLDSFPYNGHTTSLDALWMGLPVVSLAGGPIVSRAGWSQLSNLGLPELVAFSEGDYVEIAARLAHDFPRLAKLRATLRGRMEASVLMDGARFARGIEGAYRAMWKQWCKFGVE